MKASINWRHAGDYGGPFGGVNPTEFQTDPLLKIVLAAPKQHIMLVAGLAMLRVLQAGFVASFRSRFTLGALICFLVTVPDLTVLNVGAAFWGLMAGLGVSWLLERPDFELPGSHNSRRRR